MSHAHLTVEAAEPAKEDRADPRLRIIMIHLSGCRAAVTVLILHMRKQAQEV